MIIYNPGSLERLPDGILFDTDNTLYLYEPAHNAAMVAVRTKFESILSVRPKDFDMAFNEARKQVKERLYGTASSHSRLLYLQRTLELIGLGSQVLWALDLEQTYWRTFLSNAVLFDGVKECLDEVRRLKIPTAIVTDLTAQIQFRKIIYFGLDSYFDYMVTSEEAGRDKPAQNQFQLALHKMSLNGDLVWMIGDNFENDICGAKKSIAAKTILKLNSNRPRPSELLDACFDDYSSLTSLIRALGSKVN